MATFFFFFFFFFLFYYFNFTKYIQSVLSVEKGHIDLMCNMEMNKMNNVIQSLSYRCMIAVQANYNTSINQAYTFIVVIISIQIYTIDFLNRTFVVAR